VAGALKTCAKFELKFCTDRRLSAVLMHSRIGYDSVCVVVAAAREHQTTAQVGVKQEEKLYSALSLSRVRRRRHKPRKCCRHQRVMVYGNEQKQRVAV
jgi:hypothetical protein